MGILNGQARKLSLQGKPSGFDPKRFQWGAIIIVVIIVGAFVVAPVIPSFLGGGVYTFGSYKGTPIEFYPGSDMEREVSSLSREIPPEAEGMYRQFYYQQIWYTAFMRQAMRLAMADRIASTGLLISDEKSNELVKTFEGFTNGNGEFDLTLYNRYGGEQKALIRKELEKAFLWSHFENDIVNAPLSPAFLSWVTDMAKTSLSVSWVKFTKEDISRADLERYVGEKGDLLLSAPVELIAFGAKGDANKTLASLSAGEMTQDEIASEQREDFSSALYYELANLVTEADQGKLLTEMQAGEGLTSLYNLADGRFGFFAVKGSLDTPDLAQSVIRDKVILYLQMNQDDLYQELLEGVASANYRSRTATTDSVTLNAGGTTLYSPDLGGLANFAGYDDFYKTVFALQVGEWSRPFVMGDDVYVFQLFGRNNNVPVNAVQIKEALMTEKAQNLQGELLNEKDFKNNFFEVYYKSGISHAVNTL